MKKYIYLTLFSFFVVLHNKLNWFISGLESVSAVNQVKTSSEYVESRMLIEFWQSVSYVNSFLIAFFFVLFLIQTLKLKNEKQTN